MHPALTHELTRAVLADRERESRDATLRVIVVEARARLEDRPFHAPRRAPIRRLEALVTRRRASRGASASAR